VAFLYRNSSTGKGSIVRIFAEVIKQKGKVCKCLVGTSKNAAEKVFHSLAPIPSYDSEVGVIQMFRHAVRQNFSEYPCLFIERDGRAPASSIRKLEERRGFRATPPIRHRFVL